MVTVSDVMIRSVPPHSCDPMDYGPHLLNPTLAMQVTCGSGPRPWKLLAFVLSAGSSTTRSM